MKIHIKKTFNEWITGSGRCSDGSYRSSSYTNSVNIYSDTDKIYLTTAEKICYFIETHSNSGDDRIWDWSFDDVSTEKYDIELTEELVKLLNNENVIASDSVNECPILLNHIAIEIRKSHKFQITELTTQQSLIHKKYLNDLEISKAQSAKKSFLLNEGIYDFNELMADYAEYPLDIARISNDIDFFEFLLLNKSIKVKDPYVFAEWLCKVGKFEYLESFLDLSKLQLIRVGSSIHNDQLKNYRLTECILYYAIVNNRLDVFNEYGYSRFNKEISEVNFSEISRNYYSHNYISVGLLAVKYSNLETVKELYGKCSFFENIKLNNGSTKTILSEDCFRDYNTAHFFLEKLFVDSIFAMLYWKKNELLHSFFELKKFNFGNIYLTAFSDFFVQENNSIITHLANINSFSLIKVLNKDDNKLVPSCFHNNMYVLSKSVLEKCASQKNFVLLKKMFSICIEKEKILSFDACRLLYTLCKFDENNELEELKQIILKLIDTEDLMRLLGVACIEINLNLLIFLITKVDNINASVDIEPTSFGLEAYKGRVNTIVQNYKKGTLLHLALVANPNEPGRWLNTELIKILLNEGVDKSIKDKSSKLAFDYIKNCYSYRDDSSQKKELVKILYIEDIKICSKKGELIGLFNDTELPIVNKFESFLLSGINAVDSYKTNKIEALNFFLSCGAELESLKEEVELEKRRSEITVDSTNYDYDDSYSEQELRDMYRDAFDGNPDAEWNID